MKTKKSKIKKRPCGLKIKNFCDDGSLLTFGSTLQLKKDKACTYDPVRKHDNSPDKPKTKPKKQTSSSIQIIPSFGTRLDIKTPVGPAGRCGCGMNGMPLTPYFLDTPRHRRMKKEGKQRRKDYIEFLNFCKDQDLKSSVKTKRPPRSGAALEINIPSPDQSESKVAPRKPSPTVSTIVPETPTPSKLDLRKPKSGIIINITEDEKERKNDYDSFNLVYNRTARPDFDKEEEEAKKSLLTSITEEDEFSERRDTTLEFDSRRKSYEEAETAVLHKTIRKKVSQISDATSYKSKDFVEKGEGAEDENELKLEELEGQGEGEDQGVIEELEEHLTAVEDEEATRPYGTLTQKFRRESEIDRFQPPKKKVARGTFESHSFTKLHQPTLKEFYFGVKAGTMHQGDFHFPEISQGVQGICMPVAAYCYALIKHPSKWQESDIDEILECGNGLYLECVTSLHKHGRDRQLFPDDLQKFCYLFDKKIRFKVTSPEVMGVVRSDQKNVYNLTKGVNIFFSRNKAGIFQTKEVNIGIWKDKYYYFFDASPRTKDLYEEPVFGTALLAHVYDVESIVSILLDRCNLGNTHFAIYAVEAYDIANKNSPDEKESLIELSDKSNYNIMNETKAVVLGSFDLADKCFTYTRNKQSLAISAAALVYSKITPPSAWHKKTIDKIMMVGNQLYLESVNHNPRTDLKIDRLPADFTIGPYFIEIYVKPSIFGDLMFRKGNCILQVCYEKFFEKYSNSILEIGKCGLSVWKQRGVYFCFDPYSRNIEGFACRHGTAAVSMHSSLESLISLITDNFPQKDLIFYIHAMIVIKVNRDAAQGCIFPPNTTMNSIPIEVLKKHTMKKSKRTAVKKLIAIEDCNMSVMPPPMELDNDSLVQVGSNVLSLKDTLLPKLPEHPHLRKIGTMEQKEEVVADLDSPSLSDTQIEPPIPQEEDDGDPKVDVDSYQLTLEELEEIRGAGDAEGEGKEEGEESAERGSKEGEGDEGVYYAADVFTSVGSTSLQFQTASKLLSAEFSEFRLPQRVLHPTNLTKTLERKRRTLGQNDSDTVNIVFEPEPDVTQSEELKKENNFVDLPDNSQILRGKTNMSDLGEDLEFLAPFVCIMATAVAKKFALVSWNKDVVEYVLKCGRELYKASKLRYDQVSRLDIPRVTLGKTDFRIVVEYIFDTYLKDNILELALDRILFARADCGIFVTPSYACTIFYRHHLYYLYDGFGNNEVGMSEGPSNDGTACLVRFKDLKSLVQRIIHNKNKREGKEAVEFTRFVLSRCTVTQIKSLSDKKKKGASDDEWTDVAEGDESAEEKKGKKVDKKEDDDKKKEKEGKKEKPKIVTGYQLSNKVYTLRGSKVLKGKGDGKTEIKDDHFACICACLMLIEVPIEKWDNLKVDQVLDQGKHIFNHADDLSATEKRIIKNILIQRHFFDIIVKKIDLPMQSQNRTLSTGIDTLFYKKFSYFIVQFVGSSYVVYKSDEKTFHLFDPYGIDKKGKSGTGDDAKAGWIKFKSLNQLKTRLKNESKKMGGRWTFYTFEVTSIKKAPKGVLLGQKLHEYQTEKPKKKEVIHKPFFEEVSWLGVSPMPWSRERALTACGDERGVAETMWHNWDIEYQDDLFSLMGNINQSSRNFAVESRGKQTLCNLVMSIGMLHIYDLSAWNAAIVDSILVNGDNYFRECIKEIDEDDYELSVDDLKEECTIFPYSFKMKKIVNVVDGTIFLLRSASFNLYKALRYFFDEYETRFGIICAIKSKSKRHLAFGKTKESEYFMFDCESRGAPMFTDGKAVAYILRMTTLNRLLYTLVLTLRGGDFFIFEVNPYDFSPIG